MIRTFLQYLLILKSGFFDRHYYLFHYPDVRQADIDPLLHYIKFGWKERRNPSEHFNTSFYLEEYDDVNENPLIHYIRIGKEEKRSTNDKIRKNSSIKGQHIDQEIKESVPNSILSGEDLKKQITKKIKNSSIVISVSHDNYLNSVGGVQITIADQQEFINLKGESYLHIFPYNISNYIKNNEDPYYIGLSIDSEFLGFTNSNHLLNVISFSNDIKLTEVHIHHTMGFDFNFLHKLLQKTKKSRVAFWLHDLFSVCPNYFLLRNNIEFCDAPHIDSNSCMICSFYKDRRITLAEFSKLFHENEIEIIAPSEFSINYWKSKTNYRLIKEKIIPHAKLNWRKPRANEKDIPPLNIAFVGSPVFHKGWEEFKILSEKFGKSGIYNFFLFASEKKNGNFKYVNVSVTKSERHRMIEELSKHKIDVAILWSICPESFSYTMYESLCAGCFIITNPFSGNIQYFIRNNPDKGKILRDKEELMVLFQSKQILDDAATYQKNGKPNAEIQLFFAQREE